MEFDNNRPIYLQIGDVLCDQILSGVLAPGERIPSVREYGAQVGVNPNTVMRTYERLTSDGIIFNKRGIGYFISPDAPQRVLENEREKFYAEELPAFRKRMKLLGIAESSIFSDTSSEK